MGIFVLVQKMNIYDKTKRENIVFIFIVSFHFYSMFTFTSRVSFNYILKVDSE